MLGWNVTNRLFNFSRKNLHTAFSSCFFFLLIFRNFRNRQRRATSRQRRQRSLVETKRFERKFVKRFGSNSIHILLKFRLNLFTVPCVQSSNAPTRISKFTGTSVTYLIFFTTGFGSHINWMSYEQGLKEAKKRFDISNEVRVRDSRNDRVVLFSKRQLKRCGALQIRFLYRRKLISTLYWLFSNRTWCTPFTPLPPSNVA